MLLYVIRCVKEVKKLARDVRIQSVPRYLVNKEGFPVQRDSVLSGASRVRQS